MTGRSHPEQLQDPTKNGRPLRQQRTASRPHERDSMNQFSPRPPAGRPGDPIATAEQAHRDIEIEDAMRRHPAGKARPAESQRPASAGEVAFLTTAVNAAIIIAAYTAYGWITGGQPPL